MENIIESVVANFYKKATTDFLIGYQFRKIAQAEAKSSGSHHPLKPPIEAFEHHLPRINDFWKNQLLGIPLPEGQKPFDLIGIHKELLIRKGEVGRWIQLFDETLNETEMPEDFRIKWREKTYLFRDKFLGHPFLFGIKKD